MTPAERHGTGSRTATTRVDELRAMLEAHEPVTVVDIRTEDEFAEWHVPGSTNLPVYDELKRGDTSGLAALGSVEGPVVTVCGAGITAALATDALRADGVDARTLEGGLAAWSLAWNVADVPVDAAGVDVAQVRRTGKGCLSYIVASRGEAVVIDPALDADVLVELAAARGWTVTHVVETHVHADHLSRAGPLAEATGARHLLPAGSPVSFPHDTMADGERIGFGDAELHVLSTPGHTPESVSLLLDGAAVFTGDTLFTGGVGRPDLGAGGDAAERARTLHASLARLVALDPGLWVLPAHADGPLAFDGRPHGARLDDLANALELLGLDEDAFVEAVLARLPETPPNHDRIVEHNRAGTLPEADVTDLEAGANRCAAG